LKKQTTPSLSQFRQLKNKKSLTQITFRLLEEKTAARKYRTSAKIFLLPNF